MKRLDGSLAPSLPSSRATLSLPSRQLLATVLAASLSAPAFAGRLNYGAGVQFGWTDNVSHASRDPIASAMLIPGLDFSYIEDRSSALELSVAGHANRVHYLQGSLRDENNLGLAVDARWHILPQRLHFELKDQLVKQPVNIRQGYGPDNNQHVNVFEAGPTLELHPDRNIDVWVDLRATGASAQRTKEFNSRGGYLAVRSRWMISENQWIGAHVDATTTRFSTAYRDNDRKRYDAALAYSRITRRVDASISGGVSRITYDRSGEPSLTAPRVVANIRVKSDGRSAFTGQFARQLSEASVDILRLGDPAASNNLIGSGRSMAWGRPEVFQLTSVRIGYEWASDRTSVRANAFDEQYRYRKSIIPSVHGRGLEGSVEYQVAPRTTLQAAGMLRNSTFLDNGQRNRDLAAQFGFVHRMTRNWDLSALARYQRHTDSISRTNAYSERSVLLSINWRR